MQKKLLGNFRNDKKRDAFRVSLFLVLESKIVIQKKIISHINEYV